MGGLIELVMAYGIFMVCFTLGLVSVYSNIANEGRLYETRRPGSSQPLEVEARQDAQAYTAFLEKAQHFTCPTSFSEADFRNTASVLTIPPGYQVRFSSPPNWSEDLTSGSLRTHPQFVARLRDPSNRLIAEVLLRC